MSAPNIPVHRTMSQNIQVRRATHSCGHARVTACDFLSLQSAHPSACRAALGHCCSRTGWSLLEADADEPPCSMHQNHITGSSKARRWSGILPDVCPQKPATLRCDCNVDQKLRNDKSLNYVLYFLKTNTSYHFSFYHIVYPVCAAPGDPTYIYYEFLSRILCPPDSLSCKLGVK